MSAAAAAKDEYIFPMAYRTSNFLIAWALQIAEESSSRQDTKPEVYQFADLLL